MRTYSSCKCVFAFLGKGRLCQALNNEQTFIKVVVSIQRTAILAHCYDMLFTMDAGALVMVSASSPSRMMLYQS